MEQQREIPRSNTEFLSYSNKSSKHIYMVSEFIDNSFQSMKDNKLNNIKIDIIVNMQKEEIVIIDNSGGIPMNNIDKALTNGVEQEEYRDSLSMFGVGMKMAAFWFGKKLTIYTRHKGENPYYADLDIELLKKRNFKYIFDEIDSIENESGYHFKYETGTIIKISKLCKNRHSSRFKKDKFYEKADKIGLPEQLVNRYKRFLLDGNIITISYIDEKGQEVASDVNPGSKVLINKNKIAENYIVGNCLFDKYENKVEFYAKKLEKLEEKFYSKLDKMSSINITYGEIINRFKLRQPMVYTTELDLKEKYKSKIILKFGFLDINKHKEYKGISVFQHDRAIVSGPNSQENKLWLAETKLSHIYYYMDRFSGEIDLESDEFKVDSNKIEFQGDIKQDVIESVTHIFLDKDLVELFSKLMIIVLEKKENKSSDSMQEKNFNSLVKSFTEEKVFPKLELSTDRFDMLFEDEKDKRRITGLRVQKENSVEFTIGFIIRSLDDKNDIIFEHDYLEHNGTLKLAIILNRNFIGFNKKIKEDDFSTLINPLIKLLISYLKPYDTIQKIREKFHEILKEV